MKRAMQRWLIPTLLITGLLGGCAAPQHSNASADPKAVAEALSFATKPGLAKIYFVGGKQGFGGPFDPQIFGGEFFVNGISVGKINRDEVVAIDIVPGNYTLRFAPIGDDTSRRVPAVRVVNNGDVVIFRADVKVNKAALLVGLLAGPGTAELTEINDRGAVQGKRVIAASGCPENLCPRTSNQPTAPLPPVATQPVTTPVTPRTTEATPLEKAELKCRELGFRAGTEKYGDCVLRLSSQP